MIRLRISLSTFWCFESIQVLHLPVKSFQILIPDVTDALWGMGGLGWCDTWICLSQKRVIPKETKKYQCMLEFNSQLRYRYYFLLFYVINMYNLCKLYNPNKSIFLEDFYQNTNKYTLFVQVLHQQIRGCSRPVLILLM